MTALCALYMGALKNFESPKVRPRLLLPKFLMGFSPIDSITVRIKFKVRSFTRSRDNMGTQKIWAVPGYAHAPFSPKILKGFCSDGPCEYTCQI